MKSVCEVSVAGLPGSPPNLPCVFFNLKAVPLWPLYDISSPRILDHLQSLHDTDLLSRWVILSSSQPWLRQMAAVGVKGRSKDSMHALMGNVDFMWGLALKETRSKLVVARKHDDGGDTSGDDNASGDDDNLLAVSRCAFKQVPIVQMTFMGEYTFIVLNAQRPKVLHLSKDSEKFIRHLCVSLEGSGRMEPLGPIPPITPAALPLFSFTTCVTPNKRGKVVWVPYEHSWKLLVKSPTGPYKCNEDTRGCSLEVDRTLPKLTYLKEKLDAYRRACHAWNVLDGSKRDRIVMPTVRSESAVRSESSLSSCSSS